MMRKSTQKRSVLAPFALLSPGAILCFKTLFFVSALLAIALFRQWTAPTLSPVIYHFDDLPSQVSNLPLFVESEGKKLTIENAMRLPRLHSTIFQIKPDDCIEELTINGKIANADITRFCDYGQGRSIDLSPYLQAGMNVMTFVLRDDGGLGGLSLSVARTDTLRLTFVALFFALLAWYGLTVINYFKEKSPHYALFVIFLFGSLLRLLYVLATPHGVRGHDTGAHIDYIKYITEHWWIPPASEGWEFHQPPLYYFLAGIWMKISETLGFGEESILQKIQVGSLLISIATLGVGLWIATMLFPFFKNRKDIHACNGSALFGGLLATFPALVFLSSRITNNGLAQLLAFLTFGFLLRWWQTKDLRFWYGAIVLIGMGCLTRLSALLFLPVAFGCLLFFRELNLHQKIKYGGLSLLLLAIISSWYPALRFTEADPTNTVTIGNQHMDNGLRVGTSFANYLTFNPIQILRAPYNHPWDDAYRRQYFWEYFFKSAFLGEFSYSPLFESLHVLLLFFALLCIPLIAYGLYRECVSRPYETLPLWMSFCCILGAHLFYRTIAPFSSNQDFRFSVIILIPLLYYLVAGLYCIPNKYYFAGIYIITATITSCSAFLGMIYFFVI